MKTETTIILTTWGTVAANRIVEVTGGELVAAKDYHLVVVMHPADLNIENLICDAECAFDIVCNSN